MLPIPDPHRLLRFAWSAPWDKLSRFVTNEGARGHTAETISEFVRIVERRRWQEWDRVHAQRAIQQNRPMQSQRERIQAAIEKRYQRSRTLEELRQIDPYDFERLVASLFDAQGYDARAVGGTADDGIDVVIRDQAGDMWGVAQCKRYVGHKVSATHIRDFGGAFVLSKAQHGFYFTTSELTRHAKKTARGFPWLTVINGPQLVTYVEDIKRKFEQSTSG
jgi:restriction endonuclease Mrr